MKNLTKILISIYVVIMMIAVACKKEEPTPTPPVTTPTTTPPVVTKSTTKDITKFSFAALSPAVDATIDAANKTISATVPAGTDATKLVPTITISDKATISPASGVATDFSKEVSYTVTAEDLSVVVWKVSISVIPSTTGTVSADNVIYIKKEPYDKTVPNASYLASSGNYIVAIDAITGKEIASFLNTKSEISLYPKFYTNKSLIFGGGSSSDAEDKNWTLDVSTGKMTSLPLKYIVYEGGVFDGTNLYAYGRSTAEGSGLIAMDINTGAKKWKVDQLNPTYPTVSDGLLYLCRQGYQDIVCYDINTQTQKWKFNHGLPAATMTNPAVVNGILYFTAYNVVFALDAKTGVKKWEYKSEGSNTITESLTVANDMVYVGGGDKKVYALDAKTGVKKWDFLTQNSIKAITMGSDLIYATNGQQFIALDALTGTQKWIKDNTAGLYYPVQFFANNMIYMMTSGGLIAMDGASGNTKWELKNTYKSNITKTLDTYLYGSGFCLTSKNKMYFPNPSGMQQ